jgi:hypothetical protein
MLQWPLDGLLLLTANPVMKQHWVRASQCRKAWRETDARAISTLVAMVNVGQ